MTMHGGKLVGAAEGGIAGSSMFRATTQLQLTGPDLVSQQPKPPGAVAGASSCKQ